MSGSMGPPRPRFAGKGPAAKRPKAAASGGVDLLDSILGGLDTMTARSSKAGSVYRPGDELETASHYQMLRPSGAHSVPKGQCRNIGCEGRDFENDCRAGDRVCRLCGAVQNARNVESQEEEHRTFADDDKKESKQRTSRVDGRGGGAVGSTNLQSVHNLAEKMGTDGDGLTDRQERTIQQYQEKVGVLSAKMNLSSAIKVDAEALCMDLVHKQKQHDAKCCEGDKCHLHLGKLLSHALVAAALLKTAMRKDGTTDRLFLELKETLKGDDVDAADAKKIGPTYTKCEGLLKGPPYPCDPEASEAAAAKQAEALRGGGGEEEEGEGGGGSGGGASGGAPPPPHASIALLPRLCNALNLPYYLQNRGTEIIEDWVRAGIPSSRPETISASALLRAHEEIVKPALRRGVTQDQLPMLDMNKMAEESGIKDSTLTKMMKHEDFLWPTRMLEELLDKLKTMLPLAARPEAIKILDRWLSANPKDSDRKAWEDARAWVRARPPRIVAASALVLGAREVTSETDDPYTSSFVTAVASAAHVKSTTLEDALAEYRALSTGFR